MTRPKAATLLIIGAVLVLGASGCSKTGTGFGFARFLRPWEAPLNPAPTPDSPAAALRLFEWSYNNKSLARYVELFARDYRFFFSPLDSAGVMYRDTPWVRDDELISTTHLLVGGSADQPPASRILLALDKNFFVAPDPRSLAWDPQGRWHKNIRTQIVLNVQMADGNTFDISGAADFYLVRGDSADIPADLVARGFRPDSTRWWIGRWDDETAQAGPTPDRSRGGGGTDVAGRPPVLAAQPSSSTTWGRIKVLYR